MITTTTKKTLHTSAALSLREPRRWSGSVVVLLPEGGGARRRAVTGGRPPRSRLSYESTFSRDSRLRGAAATDKKLQWLSWFSPPPSSSSYPGAPPLHSSLCPHSLSFPSCLLIGVVAHHLFPRRGCRTAAGANCCQRHLQAVAGRPPGRSKKNKNKKKSSATHPVEPAGLCSLGPGISPR